MSTILKSGFSLEQAARRANVSDARLRNDINAGVARTTSAGGRFTYMTPGQLDAYRETVQQRQARIRAEEDRQKADDAYDADREEHGRLVERANHLASKWED